MRWFRPFGIRTQNSCALPHVEKHLSPLTVTFPSQLRLICFQLAGKEVKIQRQVGIVGLMHGLFDVKGGGVQVYYTEELRLACIAFGVNPPIELGHSRYANKSRTLWAFNPRTDRSVSLVCRCDQLLFYVQADNPGPAESLDLKTVGSVGFNTGLAANL